MAATTLLQKMVSGLHDTLHRWDQDVVKLKERCVRLDKEIIKASGHLKEHTSRMDVEQKRAAVKNEEREQLKKKRERLTIR